MHPDLQFNFVVFIMQKHNDFLKPTVLVNITEISTMRKSQPWENEFTASKDRSQSFENEKRCVSFFL